jgi:hypothetical protein
MKKLIIVVSIIVALLVSTVIGSGIFHRWLAGVLGGGTEECVDGVLYLQFTSGASVAYSKDGKIKTCS